MIKVILLLMLPLGFFAIGKNINPVFLSFLFFIASLFMYLLVFKTEKSFKEAHLNNSLVFLSFFAFYTLIKTIFNVYNNSTLTFYPLIMGIIIFSLYPLIYYQVNDLLTKEITIKRKKIKKDIYIKIKEVSLFSLLLTIVLMFSFLNVELVNTGYKNIISHEHSSFFVIILQLSIFIISTLKLELIGEKK